MFYDERIEKERGRISRNAICVALAMSLMLGIPSVLNIALNGQGVLHLYLYVVIEALVAAVGALILIIGTVKSLSGERDERASFEMARFYGKAAKILLAAAMLAYAVFCPLHDYIRRPSLSFQYASSSIYSALMPYVVGIYIVYALKRYNIYLNYSFIENENYYRGVFKNIGKFALASLLLFGLSCASVVVFTSGNFKAFKRVSENLLLSKLVYLFIIYLLIFIALSLLYLLFSFWEKENEKKEHGLSKATYISFFVTLALHAIYSVLIIIADNVALTQESAIRLIYMMQPFAPVMEFMLLVFLAYFCSEYGRGKSNRAIAGGMLCIFLAGGISTMISGASSNAIYILIEHAESAGAPVGQIVMISNYITAFLQNTTGVFTAAGYSAIIVALIKDKKISGAHTAFIGAAGIYLLLEVYLVNGAGSVVPMRIFTSLAKVAGLIYVSILLYTVMKNKNTITEGETI